MTAPTTVRPDQDFAALASLLGRNVEKLAKEFGQVPDEHPLDITPEYEAYVAARETLVISLVCAGHTAKAERTIVECAAGVYSPSMLAKQIVRAWGITDDLVGLIYARDNSLDVDAWLGDEIDARMSPSDRYDLAFSRADEEIRDQVGCLVNVARENRPVSA